MGARILEGGGGRSELAVRSVQVRGFPFMVFVSMKGGGGCPLCPTLKFYIEFFEINLRHVYLFLLYCI